MSTITHDGDVRPAVVGQTLFDHADALAVEVATSCHRNGRCHECIVEVTRGAAALSAPTEAESFLRGAFRLACQARIERDDLDIAFAPLRRRPRILVSSPLAPGAAHDPMVHRDAGRVFYGDEPIDEDRGRVLGIAVDLGTTTVVLDVVDLEAGESVHTAAFENPQRFGGSDVMHRISYDGRPTHRGELRKAIVAALNRAIDEACTALSVPRAVIYEVVVAANTTMRDILFKLDVQAIGQRPYKSLTEHALIAGERPHTALEALARRLGLTLNPAARAYGLPLIASHAGGDAAADIVAVGLDDGGDETVMLVDMGTNTEVVLRHRGRLLATSCPAGPAFEGGLVKYGMPASDGAIEQLRYVGDEAVYRTIGAGPPVGLCGSGLIDLLAALRRAERLSAKGVFIADRKQFAMTVVPEAGITISKEDVSNLGQAKAANYCGQYIAMRALGVDPASVDRLYLAGGFANYVDVSNAIAIGLLAPVPEERIVKVGNAAAEGARALLLSRRKRRALERFVQGIGHIELETTPDFFEIFVDGCQFDPMPRIIPPAPDGALAAERDRSTA